MARPCSICTDPKLRETVDRLIAEGVSDHETARRVATVSRMAVTRHRNAHVLAPARQQLAVLDKGQTAARERRDLAKAAAEDAPSPADFVKAAFGLEATAKKLQAIEGRLERMADRAEQVGSSTGVAALSAQQLRGVEVGARLAGAGGYAATRPGADGAQPAFSITINLGGQAITIGASPTYGPAPDIEGEMSDVMPEPDIPP